MLENATVTLSLNELDELRSDSKGYLKLRRAISKCYTIDETELPEPEECKGCVSDADCDECKYRNPLYKTSLIIDVDTLIKATMSYATYSKDCDLDDADISEIIKK